MVAAGLAGLVAGIVVTLAATEPRIDAAGTTATTSPRAQTTTTVAPTTSTAPDAPGTLLAWTSGGLPAAVAADVASLPGVEAVTTVRGDQTSLVAATRSDGSVVDELRDGWAIPLDTIAVEPGTFGGFVGDSARPLIEALAPGRALLTESSMELRDLDIGARIELRGATLTVDGVVDDLAGAGAELIVHAADAAAIGAATERYLLLHHEPGARASVTEAIDDLVGERTIRFRSDRETTWLRHGDAVKPQVFVKLAFGEFAFRDRGGRDVEVERAWLDASIVDAAVPILGTVRCHRALVAPLQAAMGALADENLGHLVDPAAFAGCWSPRRIAAGEPLSRHAWGIAVDLNIEGNPRGSFSSQDERLVEAMRSAGFTWGGTWLVPDPGHYELIPG